MISFQCRITDSEGIHERQAGLLVREAMKFSSCVSIDCKDRTGDARRLFSILGMGMEEGDEVRVETEGEDEVRAAVCLSEFFRRNL